jgi:protein-lysine N-methyltransferase EEF2KMT
MEHMGKLLSLPKRSHLEEVEEPHVHSYYPPVPLEQVGLEAIWIKEAKNLLSRGNNVGLRTWEAALHLAWYLFNQRRELVRGRNVIELGAGTGFLSLLCAGHLQASSVVATDGLGHVCESLQANVELNAEHTFTSGPPTVTQLDWTDQPAIDDLIEENKKAGRQYDLIIGADITYHPDILKPLARLLSILNEQNPAATILISAAIRSDTFSNFLAICRDNFCFEVLEEKVEIPEGLRYSGFFHSVATPIKAVSLSKRGHGQPCCALAEA